MIHEFIFAAPKPGMSAQEFQDYWVNVHAVNYASKIRQIKRYLIDTRIPFDGDVGTPPLPHQGIAEIWLPVEEQLASLQSDEFLQGARLDEPKWAAFWQTIVVDTQQTHEILAGPGMQTDPSWIKITYLLKRQSGMSLADYRLQSLGSYASAVSKLPGLRRYIHNHAVDGLYTFSESSFDSVEQLWFDDIESVQAALASPQFREQVQVARTTLLNPNYIFSMVSREHWIIGPDARP
ncbi:MAG: EthD family reductase [Cyanophyceae cyanobacterium]